MDVDTVLFMQASDWAALDVPWETGQRVKAAAAELRGGRAARSAARAPSSTEDAATMVVRLRREEAEAHAAAEADRRRREGEVPQAETERRQLELRQEILSSRPSPPAGTAKERRRAQANASGAVSSHDPDAPAAAATPESTVQLKVHAKAKAAVAALVAAATIDARAAWAERARWSGVVTYDVFDELAGLYYEQHGAPPSGTVVRRWRAAFPTDAERAALYDALPGEPPSLSASSAPQGAPEPEPAPAPALRQTRVVLDIANIGHHRLTHEINSNPHTISFRWEASVCHEASPSIIVRTREQRVAGLVTRA